jgi:SAM-dependent methyltransferase
VDERHRYLQHENARDDSGYVATFDEPIRCLSQYAPGARRVLDYGCGPTPVLIDLLRERGYDALGYDPCFSPVLNDAKRFDAILCVETSEHFRSPRDEFERMCRLLTTSGCIVVKTMMHRGPDSIEGWWYARDATHVAFYSRATFDWIERRFGMTLVECDSSSLACFVKPSE